MSAQEPPAFEIANAHGAGNAVLVCDHASNRIPHRLGTLGLNPSRLADHIAWDPGAAKVARRLSALLDAPLLLSNYSRLVIDCNRQPLSQGLITEQSSGVSVPGNIGLSQGDRDSRVEELFEPYHRAIGHLLDGRRQRPSVLLSIHSFTPLLNDGPRPWHIGVSYRRDRRLAALMLGSLANHEAIVVGENKPYAIEDGIDYTLPLHGEGRGLPHTMIEIRQDQIRTEQGVTTWAARLAEAYLRIEAEALRFVEP